MYRIFSTLMLLILLALVPASGQQPTPPSPIAAQLELKEVIEILADYNIKHQDEIAAGQYWGLTDYSKRTITISDTPDFSIRKLTAIHELLHAIYFQKGMDTGSPAGEAWVEAEAIRIYMELFGIKGH